MSTQASSAYGTLLKLGDGNSPEVFTTVPEVGTIEGPSMEIGEAEVTTHSSAAAGAFKEFILTLIDAGTIEFPMNYVPADPIHIRLRQHWLARTKKNWQIVLPASVQTISFSAYIKSAPFSFPMDGPMTQKLTLRLTGAVTFS